MLRFRILASVVPLMAIAVFTRGELVSGARPCIVVGDGSAQITSLPWQADLHVSFTDDPAQATVWVQISDSAEAADFAVIDDVDSPPDDACAITPATRFIAVSGSASSSEPVIYLTRDGPADYRIYVKSKRFTARDAAALLVGANGGHRRLQAAAL
jgi:hypothetical protein